MENREEPHMDKYEYVFMYKEIVDDWHYDRQLYTYFPSGLVLVTVWMLSLVVRFVDVTT
jgi:hypothetical protein